MKENKDNFTNNQKQDDLIADITPIAESEEETKRRRKRKSKAVKAFRRRRFITVAIILILVIAISIPAYLRIYLPRHASEFYDEVVLKYSDSLFATDLPEGYSSLFGSLYRINSDVSGFISVPGTDVNYPVVSLNEERDKSYYNYHIFDRSYNHYGTPYFTEESNPLLKDEDGNRKVVKNTVISGKYSLLSSIKNYFDYEFYIDNPVILMDDVYQAGYWKVIAAYKCPKFSDYDPFITEYENADDLAKYINYASENSCFIPGCNVNTNDRFLSIVSEEYEGVYYVLIARLQRENELISIDKNSCFSKNVGDSGISCSVVNESSTFEIKYYDEELGKEISNTVTKDFSVDSSNSPLGNTYIEREAEKVDNSPITDSNKPENVSDLTVFDVNSGTRVTDSALKIVASIVQSEVGQYESEDLFKAQAIATYSYLLYSGTNDNPVSVKLSDPSELVLKSVESVLGQVLIYNNEICNAMYFPISAGMTASCFDSFGNNVEYLNSVDSMVDSNSSDFSSAFTISADELSNLISEKLGIETVGEKSAWISIDSFDSSGSYVSNMSICGNTMYKNGDSTLLITGRVFNEKVLSNSLKSHAFEIEYSEENDSFTFISYGQGHGVGMSQYGASVYASQGHDYNWILNHYYPGTSIRYIQEEK